MPLPMTVTVEFKLASPLTKMMPLGASVKFRTEMLDGLFMV